MTNRLASSLMYRKGNHAFSYTDVLVQNAGHSWRDGMVSGNGENGYVTSGAPYSDTFIFQYMWNNFPSRDPRSIPEELTSQLDEARYHVFTLNDQWRIKHSNGETRIRTFYYSYHPSHQLRLSVRKQSKLTSYIRWTNYETAETGVQYGNEACEWTRTSFTSRVDNVSITKITQSSTGTKINMILSIDDISVMSGAYDGVSKISELQYKKLVDSNARYIAQVAHYPSYAGSELAEGGYAGLTKVIVVNGTKERIKLGDSGERMNVGEEQNPAIRIIDAEAVYLITQASRTFNMGKIEEFAAASEYEIIDQLLASTKAVEERYIDVTGQFDYDAALASHASEHAAEFNAVQFQLAGDETDKSSDNLELIRTQKENPSTMNHAFLEQVYHQGRYAMICSGGSSAPRLYGMWTGEWNPGWRSIYTLDANVNLQVAAMNTGHLSYSPLGYITFFLRNAPDFEYNARMAYGMHDALQISVNSDGDRAMHVEYDNDYPFSYWNAGASWCLLPIYEYWQCYGNRKIPIDPNMRILDLQQILGVEDGGLSDEAFATILKQGYMDLEQDILLPLLTKQANFWEQICTPEYYTNIEGNATYEKGKKELLPGEKYLIIPAYSPENHPIGYSSTLTANATMDIGAARDGLYMVIALERAVKREGYEKAIAKWEALLEQLPSYAYDQDGALREWAMKEYVENNNHRHLSHLYPAWPGYETQHNDELKAGVKKALHNRNTFNTGDATAGHGWMHKALVAARLKDGNEIVASLLPMMVNDGYYASLMTDHDTNRRMNSFCTDTLFGTVAAINEALLYSNTGEIELLPALPTDWITGSICGLMARTRIEVTELCWDLQLGIVSATLCSIDNQRQTVHVTLARPWEQAEIDSKASNPVEEGDRKFLAIEIGAGDEVNVQFMLKSK